MRTGNNHLSLSALPFFFLSFFFKYLRRRVDRTVARRGNTQGGYYLLAAPKGPQFFYSWRLHRYSLVSRGFYPLFLLLFNTINTNKCSAASSNSSFFYFILYSSALIKLKSDCISRSGVRIRTMIRRNRSAMIQHIPIIN